MKEQSDVPSLAADKLRASGAHIERQITNDKIRIRVSLPINHTFDPKFRPHQMPLTMTTGTLVEVDTPSFSITDIEQWNSLQVEKKRIGSHSQLPSLAVDHEGWWTIPQDLPEPIIAILEKILLHETLTNPNIYDVKCFVSLRLQTPDNSVEKFDPPHIDGGGVPSSIYMYALGTTTIEYTNTSLTSGLDTLKQNMTLNKDTDDRGFNDPEMGSFAAASYPQGKIVHIDGNTVHSEPWKKFENNVTGGKRFFLRVTFQ